METYTSKTGRVLHRPSVEELREAAYEDAGFCFACGNRQDGCEPDMRRGKCEECGETMVYGAEELALMGVCHS